MQPFITCMNCTQFNSAAYQVRPAASIEDADLIRCMKAGCADCFSVFFRRYCKLAFAIAYRILRQTSDAEDVVQEVFIAIFQQTNPFDPERASVQTWLAQFAHFKALQYRRRLNSYKYIQLEEWLDLEQNARHGSLQSIQERAILVEQCLLTLNPQQRRTIELVHFDGYTLAETAKILNETVANIRNHYYRGLKSLRTWLRVYPTAGASTEDSKSNRRTWNLVGKFVLGADL